MINVSQYSSNCATWEGHTDSQHEKRTLQIIRSTLLSDTSLSIVSGNLAYLKSHEGRDSSETVDKN